MKNYHNLMNLKYESLIFSINFYYFLSDYPTPNVKDISAYKRKHSKEITLSGFKAPFNGQLKILYANNAYCL